MDRVEGFYWVRILEVGPFPELKVTPGAFQVAFWDGRHWQLAGNELDFHDRDFSFISAAPITEPENI